MEKQVVNQRTSVCGVGNEGLADEAGHGLACLERKAYAVGVRRRPRLWAVDLSGSYLFNHIMKPTQEEDSEAGKEIKSGLPKSMITSFTFPSKQQASTSTRHLRPRKSSSTPSPSKHDRPIEPKAKKPKIENKKSKHDDESNEVLRNLPDHIRQGIQGKLNATQPLARSVTESHDLLLRTVMICGINPGLTSSRKQAHFAHHSNHFWKCLHISGLTPTQLLPSEDHTLPDQQPPYLRM